jgi:hypothetical protein
LQNWLKIYNKLKKRAEREVNKNRKIKFRRQLQAWLGVNCRSEVRTEVNKQMVGLVCVTGEKRYKNNTNVHSNRKITLRMGAVKFRRIHVELATAE